MFGKGDGVEKDLKKAKYHWELAAIGGMSMIMIMCHFKMSQLMPFYKKTQGMIGLDVCWEW